jgi:energy-coupling factor transporter transmembrane protein EcfT
MMGFIGALITFFIALWVFSDARSRGKSNGVSFLWFVGTWFLVILFSPLWLFVRPSKFYIDSSIDKSRNCVCGRSYEGSPAFCQNCGNSLRN